MNRALVWLGVVGVGVAVFVHLSGPLSPRFKAGPILQGTDAKWSELISMHGVKLGMTKQQVIGLLGPPRSVEQSLLHYADLEVMVGRRTLAVLSIRSGTLEVVGSPAVSSGMSWDDARMVLGQPTSPALVENDQAIPYERSDMVLEINMDDHLKVRDMYMKQLPDPMRNADY